MLPLVGARGFLVAAVFATLLVSLPAQATGLEIPQSSSDSRSDGHSTAATSALRGTVSDGSFSATLMAAAQAQRRKEAPHLAAQEQPRSVGKEIDLLLNCFEQALDIESPCAHVLPFYALAASVLVSCIVSSVHWLRRYRSKKKYARRAAKAEKEAEGKAAVRCPYGDALVKYRAPPGMKHCAICNKKVQYMMGCKTHKYGICSECHRSQLAKEVGKDSEVGARMTIQISEAKKPSPKPVTERRRASPPPRPTAVSQNSPAGAASTPLLQKAAGSPSSPAPAARAASPTPQKGSDALPYSWSQVSMASEVSQVSNMSHLSVTSGMSDASDVSERSSNSRSPRGGPRNPKPVTGRWRASQRMKGENSNMIVIEFKMTFIEFTEHRNRKNVDKWLEEKLEQKGKELELNEMQMSTLGTKVEVTDAQGQTYETIEEIVEHPDIAKEMFPINLKYLVAPKKHNKPKRLKRGAKK